MIVVYGGTGFVGSYITKQLVSDGKFYMSSKTRIHNYEDIKKELSIYKPTHVISAAGFSTPTNIDFYEKNKSSLLLVNTAGNIILANICQELGIHLTIIMSGCIYNSSIIKQNGKKYDKIFKDIEEANFNGSYYSENRIFTENLLSIYDNVCLLRIRMPISEDMNSKSLITKLINYRNITNIPNSVTVMEDMIPYISKIIKHNITGKINLVNEGSITNSYILYLYKKYVNRRFQYKISSLEDIEKTQFAKRSNCLIQPSLKLGAVPNVRHSVINIIKNLKKIKDIYC
jgi:3,5-epimerase/4-reductase